MGFQGFKTYYTTLPPILQQIGFSGIRVQINGLTPVMVQDARKRGLSGVSLVALNPTSGTPFSTETDANGNALLQLDDNTLIDVAKDGLKKQVQYDNSGQFIITLQSNLLFA